MKKAGILTTVTDRFSIFKDGRNLNANKRKYIVESIRRMIENAQTQEDLRLGESYGFWGHQPRQRAKKLNIGETEVIEIHGRPVVVENVPSNTTKEISISDDGIVTHTQDILDTPTGLIIAAMIKSGRGGWSWATGGRESAAAAITTSYHGMDYVLQPNYLSLDHPSMMLESAEQEAMFLESLSEVGLDQDNARKAFAYMASNSELALLDRVSELEMESMLLESVTIENEGLKQKSTLRETMMLEALDSMPIFMTEEQRTALSRMETQSDLEAVKAMFKSLNDPKLNTLPLGGGPSLMVPAPVRNQNNAKDGMVDFQYQKRRTFA